MHCSTCRKSGHRKNKCPGIQTTGQDGGPQDGKNIEQEDGGQHGGQNAPGGESNNIGEHEILTGGQARKHVKAQRPKLQVKKK